MAVKICESFNAVICQRIVLPVVKVDIADSKSGKIILKIGSQGFITLREFPKLNSRERRRHCHEFNIVVFAVLNQLCQVLHALRQKILREIAMNNDGSTEVEFREDTALGDESAIEVLTEYGCVGFIRRSDKAKIRRFFDRKVRSSYLWVELFENEEGQKIYRADVNFVMHRDDPEQAWYFDDLPKQ